MKKILLIDDDVPFSISTKIALEDTGDYEVHIQNDSAAAIETARTVQPDLILLDVVMPGFDGGDIRTMLRDEPELAKIPVLIITAMLSSEDTGQSAFVESREQIMFSKPINLNKLMTEIEKYLPNPAGG
jgi:CheY-like chemotaxis protein